MIGFRPDIPTNDRREINRKANGWVEARQRGNDC
jgi:hypothetical protein